METDIAAFVTGSLDLAIERRGPELGGTLVYGDRKTRIPARAVRYSLTRGRSQMAPCS